LGAAASVRLTLFEGQILQMLAHMKELQAQSDRNREQAALDHEIAAHEQEALKQLNDQLQTQNTTLQRV